MFRKSLLTFVVVLSAVCCSDLAMADAPCGPSWMPGPVRAVLIPQGFLGADFRRACAAHDHCYVTGRSRRACDRAFSARLQCECQNSAMPGLCRGVAGIMTLNTRLFGGPAFGR